MSETELCCACECPDALVSHTCKREQLDLDTLHVQCDFDAEDYAHIKQGCLCIHNHDAKRGEPFAVALTPASARLLARALTQWAEEKEKMT